MLIKRIVTPSLLMLGLLSAGAVHASIASQKTRSYEFSLNTAAKVGTQTLTAGDYKVRLDGSNAVFTKQSNRRENQATVTAPAKLEPGSAKFDHTTIHLVDDTGQPRITSIELEGGKELLKLD